jgi:biopolymer transport protein ExbB/TolQ
MAITATQRRTREWPLFVLAALAVAAICVPLWNWANAPAPESPEALHTAHRIARRLLQPEQIACYGCFVWAALILSSRYSEVRRQRRAFALDLLPTDEGVRILPEDARPLQRKVDQIAGRRGPYILANMIRLALKKYAVSRSSQDVSETIRTQAEVDLGRLVSGMATVHYLAWAIPALGFLGTVRGLAGSLGMANQIEETSFISLVSSHLTVAFDCTLVALALSLVVMFMLHSVQRDEEALVIDCRQYCLEHLVNRLYDLEPNPEVAWGNSSGGERSQRSLS